MNNKQKKYIKGRAQKLSAIFQICKNNLTNEGIYQIGQALEKRELVKVSVLKNAEITAEEAGRNLADALQTDFMYTIGHTVVLYRKADQEVNRQLSRAVSRLD